MTSSFHCILPSSAFRASIQTLKTAGAGILSGIIAVIILLSAVFIGQASGATVMVPISESEYDNYKSSSVFSWLVSFQAGAQGSPDTQQRSEVVLGTSTQTLYGQHQWNLVNTFDINESISISYDDSTGNLYSVVGSDSFNVQPNSGFNMILVRLADGSTANGTSFTGGVIGSTNIPSMSASGGYQYASIMLDSDSPSFNLNGQFESSFGANLDTTHVMFEGFTSSVPEPSSLILCLTGSFIAFRRKRV